MQTTNKPEIRAVNVCGGINVTSYFGNSIPKDALKNGTLFFATGENGNDLGFGVVCTRLFDGAIIEAVSCNDGSKFVFTDSQEENKRICMKYVSEIELVEKLSTSEFAVYEKVTSNPLSGWCRTAAEDGSIVIEETDISAQKNSIDAIYVLGEFELPLEITKPESAFYGSASVLHAKAELKKYVDDFKIIYENIAFFRDGYEKLFLENRSLFGITPVEESFIPTLRDFICVVFEKEDCDSGGEYIWYYKSPKELYYSFYANAEACVSIEENDHLLNSLVASSIRAKNKGNDKCISRLERESISPKAEVFVLSKEEAADKCRNAVRAGRLSPCIYEKYFGECVEQEVQIATVIPFELQQRIQKTGLPIEELLEKGCDVACN